MALVFVICYMLNVCVLRRYYYYYYLYTSIQPGLDKFRKYIYIYIHIYTHIIYIFKNDVLNHGYLEDL